MGEFNKKLNQIFESLYETRGQVPIYFTQALEQEVQEVMEEIERLYPVHSDTLKKLNKYFESVSSINQELEEAVRKMNQEIEKPKLTDFANLISILQKLEKAVLDLREEVKKLESELGNLSSLNQELKKVVQFLKQDTTEIKLMSPDSAEKHEKHVNCLCYIHQKMDKSIQKLTEEIPGPRRSLASQEPTQEILGPLISLSIQEPAQEIPGPLTRLVDPDRLENLNKDFKNLSSTKRKLEESIKEQTHEMAILIVAYILFGSINFHSISNPAVVSHTKWWIPFAIFLSIALIFWIIFQAIFKKFRQISRYYNDTIREQKNVRVRISSIESGSTSRDQRWEKPHDWRLLCVWYQRFLDLLYAYPVHFGLLAFTVLNLYACITIPR